VTLAADEPRGGQQNEPTRDTRGEWKRAVALFLVVVSISPVPSTVLVGVPFVLLMLMLPARRLGGLAFAALVAFVVTAGSEGMGGLWYMERGWAVLVGGWFVAATLRWPDHSLTARSMRAVGGAAFTALAYFLTQPGSWGVLDFAVGERMRFSVDTTLEALRLLQGGENLAPALVQAVVATSEWQHALFPGLLGLASLAALGLAWWMYTRAGLGQRGALAPLTEFRFNDHYVWVFIGGLLLIVSGSGETLTRTGSNAVVFMGGLYALRGMAVVLFVNGGLTIFSAILTALALLFLAPVLVTGAVLIGLGDTWLDVRSRVARST
jgi:hypothetical protein